MKRTIKTYIGERPALVGLLRYDTQGARESAAFQYQGEWLSWRDHFAIGPDLPLVEGPQFHKKTRDGSIFHGAIADTEPDGWGRRVVLRDWAKRRQEARQFGASLETRPLTDLDFLLAVDDHSRVGALRFQDETGAFQRTAEEGRRAAPLRIELATLLAATRAVETNSETAADLAYLRGRGTSLGGLRPKCTVVDDDGHLAIGKFPSVTDERAVTKGEVLALNLARTAGITAAEARLIDSDGGPVALIRRFDRADDERLMYVSAATLMGVERTDAVEHSYTDILDAVRVHGGQIQADAGELWRRLAFSILITNIDDHLLNHGFLHMGHGHWQLAPAFDLNPSPDRVRELKTWISEDAGPGATIDGLMSVAPYFRILPPRARHILGEVEHAVSGWRDEGRRLGMNARELDQFADAFEHTEREAARKIAD